MQYTSLQAVLLIVSIWGCLVFALRLYKIRLLSQSRNGFRISAQLSRILTFGFIYCFFLFIESIDLLGFAHIYPAELFAILDECVASSGVTLGMLVVDFFFYASKAFAKSSSHGFSPKFLLFMIVISWCNLVGFAIVGVLLYDNYQLFAGIKALNCTAIFIFFIFRSSSSVRKLVRQMQEGDKMKFDKKKSQREIRLVVTKYLRFLSVVMFAAVAELVNGILHLTSSDPRWVYVYAEQWDPVFVTIRVVFMASVFLMVFLFYVPKVKITSPAAVNVNNANIAKLGTCCPSFFGSIVFNKSSQGPGTVANNFAGFNSSENQPNLGNGQSRSGHNIVAIEDLTGSLHENTLVSSSPELDH